MIYTPKKIQDCINSTTALVEHQKKQSANIAELLRTFKRIKQAMIPDFDKMIKEIEDAEIKKILNEREEQRKHDPLGTPNSFVRSSARMRIMKNWESFKVYPFERMRWDDFKYQVHQQWENDRKQLIKEGKIKA